MMRFNTKDFHGVQMSLNHHGCVQGAIVLSAVLVTFLTGCELPTGLTAGDSLIDVGQKSDNSAAGSRTPSHSPDVMYSIASETAASNAVCDPFGASARVSNESGLLAQMYYLTADQPRYSKVADYLAHGHAFEANMFFNQLSVPTRMFDQGFMDQNGSVLQTPQGNTVYEYFGLHMTTQIKLAPNETAGKYQFAILSDDGSIVKVNDAGTGFRTLISNDNTHASSLACATQTINFHPNTLVPMEIDYFQGPRYHIALLLLWRYISDSVNESTALKEVQCGQSGNEYFFNPNVTPPAPLKPWKDMAARGWKVLSPYNYMLPASTLNNTCTGSCFTDSFVNPEWNSLKLSHGDIDVKTLKVTENGVPLIYEYDPDQNKVSISFGGGMRAREIHIGYCLNGNPAPVPSVSPSPSPSPSVTPTPLPSPSPSPSSTLTPSCVGLACGTQGT